jgi:hypothetical protein
MFAAPLGEKSAVDLVTLEVHRRDELVLGPYLDARRLGKPGAVGIDAHVDATIGGARQRLHNRPVG